MSANRDVTGLATTGEVLDAFLILVKPHCRPERNFVADNLGIEVLVSLPFERDIDVAGAGTVGSAKRLPPTVSLQYHFNGKGAVSPFIGAGLNYTMFFSEDTQGALEGAKLKLDDSWGLAAHAGVDFAISKKGAIRVDVRWIDIDTERQRRQARDGGSIRGSTAQRTSSSSDVEPSPVGTGRVGDPARQGVRTPATTH